MQLNRTDTFTACVEYHKVIRQKVLRVQQITTALVSATEKQRLPKACFTLNNDTSLRYTWGFGNCLLKQPLMKEHLIVQKKKTDCSMIYFTGLRFYKIAYLVYFTLDKRKIIVLDKRLYYFVCNVICVLLLDPHCFALPAFIDFHCSG